MTSKEKWEQYTVDCIQDSLLTGWVNQAVRGLPEVQKASEKWARDILTMANAMKEQQPRESDA